MFFPMAQFCSKCGAQCSSFSYSNFDGTLCSDCTAPSEPVKLAPARPKCWKCDRELSKELDAYYGHDIDGRHYCSPCRRKLRIS